MSDLKLVKKHLIMIILANELLTAVLETRMQCSVSLETLKQVHQCPQKKEIWEERESFWKCIKINQNCSIPSEFRYHCVRDSYGNLVEVCAPLTNLKGNTCPEYNRGGERIQEDYTDSGHCERCPFSYSSNEVYNYSECLISLNDTRTTLNPDLQTSYDTRPTLNPDLQTAYNISTTLTSFNQTEVEQTNITLVIVPCIASVIVIFLIVLIVRKRLYWKTAAKKDLQKNQEQGELQSLLSTDEPHDPGGNNQKTVIQIEHESIQPNGGVDMKNEELSPPGQVKGGELQSLLSTEEPHELGENNQKTVIQFEHESIQPNGGVDMKNEELSPPGQVKGVIQIEHGSIQPNGGVDMKNEELSPPGQVKGVIQFEHESIQPNGGVDMKNEELSPPGQVKGDDEIEHETRQPKKIFNEMHKKHSGIDQDTEVYNEDDEIENEIRQPKGEFKGTNNKPSAIDRDKEGFGIGDETENVIIKRMAVMQEKNEKLSPLELDKKGGKDSTLSLSPAYYKGLRAIEIGKDTNGRGQE